MPTHHSIRFLAAMLLIGTLAGGSAAANPPTSPNILIILTDDQGWGDLSLHGNTMVRTPQLDQLAAEGVQFEQFFVQPVCSPTRAELLTGRYHARGGVYDTGAGGERLDLDEYTLAQALQSAGYHTGLFGKWHNGSQYPYHPMARGFDTFYGFSSGHWGLYFDPMIEHNGAMTRAEGYLTDALTEQSMAFMRESQEAGQPFFVLLTLNTPHSPMQVPDAYWERFKDLELTQRGTDASREEPLHTRVALAMVENIDWNVGRVMQFLEQEGLEESTLVLFLSDNGPNGDRWNGGMRGRKGSIHAGGVRSPLFMRWPGRLEAGRVVRQIAGVIDLMPTLVDLAGIPLDPPNPLDGRSLVPLLSGSADLAWDERELFFHWNQRIALRTQHHHFDEQDGLYDMLADPGQTQDLRDQRPELANRFADRIAEWREQVLTDAFDSDRPFPVGHPDFHLTHLPARDAVAIGTIQRSNRWPNDSFFRNWTHVDDTIEWDIVLLEPGLFAIHLWYACPERDLGARIQLDWKGESLSIRLTEAHDPPFLGTVHNRSPLYESPVKIFRKLSMGALEMVEGRGKLTLHAPEIPGGQAAEIRMLSLHRIR